MEQAAADQVINVDDIEHTVSRMREKKDKRALGEEDTTLLQLQQRAKDSDHILSALQSKLAAPLSEVDAFGSYIQATLGAMSKKKFRQSSRHHQTNIDRSNSSVDQCTHLEIFFEFHSQ